MDLRIACGEILWISHAIPLGCLIRNCCIFPMPSAFFGVHIHHIGDNPESAAQMGINVDRTRIFCFMFCGIGAAFAGIFSTLVNFTWWPTQGFGYLLLALASVFVGGTPTWGGVGTIFGAVFGSGVIAYMETGIVAMGWSGLWRQFFNGLIIILALLGHRFHGNRIR